MTRCSCVTYEQIGVGVPMVHALRMAAESQAECPVHRGCEHRSGGGMCANCVPEMFPNLPPTRSVADVSVSDDEVEFWQKRYGSYGVQRDPKIIRENIERGKRLGTYDPHGAHVQALGQPPVKHEVPPPVGVSVTDTGGRPLPSLPTPAASSPDEDEVAIALVRKLLRQRADELGVSVADLAAEYLPVLQERVRAARMFA